MEDLRTLLFYELKFSWGQKFLNAISHTHGVALVWYGVAWRGGGTIAVDKGQIISELQIFRWFFGKFKIPRRHSEIN